MVTEASSDKNGMNKSLLNIVQVSFFKILYKILFFHIFDVFSSEDITYLYALITVSKEKGF